MQLSKRLNGIVSFIEKKDKVADIGTDHGFVPTFLVNNNISDYVVSSDISENSLLKSIELTKEYSNEDKIINRVGPGLEVLSVGEVDTAIIAGMGGLLISDIIKDSFEISKNLKKLILQPMQAQSELRKFLYKNGFKITDEMIVFEEKKYFEIIETHYVGQCSISDEIFYEIPEIPYKRKDEIVKNYLENRINYTGYIIDNLNKSKDRGKVLLKINELEIFIKKCRELLNGV